MEQPAGMTAELYKAVVAVVDERVGEIKVTRRDFDELKGVVKERVGGLEQAMEKLAQAQTRTEISLRKLAQQVGKLSENVGFGLEDVARVVLPDYLAYRHNLQLEGEPGEELRRVFFQVDGREVEISL